MFKFFFKKNLCDVWDNLFFVVVTNLISIAVAVLSVFIYLAAGLVPGNELVKTFVLFGAVLIDCVLISIFAFAHGWTAAKIADFETPYFSEYFLSIVRSIKDGALFGIFCGVLIAVVFVSVPYYFGMWKDTGNFLWLLIVALIFWFMIITILALQWFLPVRSLMKDGFKKCLKKSYILFFDNAGFTILLAFVNLGNIILSVVTLGLYPSVAGIVITNTNALRLRMYKYDWWEVNPTLSPKERKQVPWDALLEKDKKTLGPRKFKSFFMPWKN